MKYVSIDLETTGLDRVKHNIVEFGAVIDDLSKPEVPISQLPVFHRYNILDEYVGSPFALSMHPTIFRRIATKEEGYEYCYNGKLGADFYKFLTNNGFEAEENSKLYINCAGKNFASFDLPFIENHTDIANHRIKIRHRCIDPGSMFMTIDDDAVPGSEECLKRAGLDDFVAHTAVEDAKGIIRMLRKKFYPAMGLVE